MTFPARLLEHILPPRTEFNTRIPATLVDRLLQLDADQIRHLWDPWKCQIDELPYLAWALSVDIWDTTWPEAKKRAVVASAFSDHKIKGTLGGIEKYLGYRDTAIDKAIVPPERCYGIIGLTDAQRAAYIASLPQIRIYPFLVLRDTPPKRAFMTGPAGFRTFYRADPGVGSDNAPPAFMQVSEGRNLYGRRATIQTPDGVEADVTLNDVTFNGQNTAEQVLVQFGESKRLFMNHGFFGKGFMQKSRAGSNIATVSLSQDAPSQFAALSGATVQDVRPQRVFQLRAAPKGRFFLGRDFLGASAPHMLQTDAPRQIYDQFALIDGENTPKLNKGRSFMGYARFGIAPYTAELRIEVPMNRPRWRLGVGRGQFLTGFMKQTDLTPLDNALTAIGQSRALSDTILVDTEIYRTVQLGDGLKLGSFKLGQQMRRT